jgi:hypothetical protein
MLRGGAGCQDAAPMRRREMDENDQDVAVPGL